MDSKFDVCVVGGAGHVGLPLSIVFASRGQRVLIFDVNRESLAVIGAGKMPFMESGAEPLLKQALDDGLLEVTSEIRMVERAASLVIVIGTPIDEFMNPSLKAILGCIDDLLPYIHDDQLLVLRSTVYPGVTEAVSKYLSSKGKNPMIAFCPERIVQGKAVQELLTLPQIVSGTTSEGEQRAADLFSQIAPEIVRLSAKEAELVKLLSNAYRYIQFATTNQFYLIAKAAGVDYYRVLDGMKRNYPRMGDVPRAGFAAGPCLFKDTMQLAAFFQNRFSLGHAAMLVNESMPMFILEDLVSRYPLESMVVGLLGMAFKADNDDSRSSLSYKLKKLATFHAKRVLTTDPYVTTDPTLLPLDDVIAQSDVIILCAPHSVYKGLTFPGKIVVDIWDFWTQEQASAAPV